MVKVKRIGVLSLGKVFGLLYAIIGLIVGALFTLLSSFLQAGVTGVYGGLFGKGAIIYFPLLYGILGFLMGLLLAFLYNLIAKWTGGLEMEFEQEAQQ